jgi:hypothetical protein
VHFIQHHQPLLVRFQKEPRLRKLGSIGAIFEVQIQRVALAGDIERQCRLARLPRPDKRRGGLVSEGPLHARPRSAGNHPCNLSSRWMICKVKPAIAPKTCR